jgi:hypothetical protein
MPYPNEDSLGFAEKAILRRDNRPDGVWVWSPIGMPKPTDYAKREGLRALPQILRIRLMEYNILWM